MTPEEQARQTIDHQLAEAGWVVQDASEQDVSGALGVAIGEVSGDTGRADYVLYLDGKACGIIEAKRSDHTLEGVQEQSASYSAFRRWHEPDTCWQNPLPFHYEANGRQIQFTDARDPEPRAVGLHIHRPEQANRAFDVLKRKFFCEGGRKNVGNNFEEWGLKIHLPPEKRKAPMNLTEATTPTGFSQSTWPKTGA